jgi:hypothetical protein
MTLENIGAMLARIGRYMGKEFTLDSRGALALSYAGNRSCMFAAQDGFRPRIGMSAPLVADATDEIILRASVMNASLERDSGVLALDARGTLILTSARDAADLTEETLANFISDFVKIAVELGDALQLEKQDREGPEELVRADHPIIWC